MILNRKLKNYNHYNLTPAALRAIINRIRSDKPTYGSNLTSLKAISIPDTIRTAMNSSNWLTAVMIMMKEFSFLKRSNNLKLLTSSS
jgi:hypothetical protein